MKITDVRAKEIRDSRNTPTLFVEVEVEHGATGSFAVPSGASTGSTEAFELRDDDGRMQRALLAIEREIRGALVGRDASHQAEIDRLLIDLDGTERKTRLGGNTIIGTSVAVCVAAARARAMQPFEYIRELTGIAASDRPVRMYMNLINGGKHAHTRLPFQEYMIVPQCASAREAKNVGMRLMELVDEALRARGTFAIGDEGGIAFDTPDPEEPIRILDGIRESRGLQFDIALDVAATSFFSDGSYEIGGAALSAAEHAPLIERYARTYGLLSVEDPFEENDFDSFASLKTRVPDTMIVGDDLTTTNPTRLREAISRESVGALIIKPNQIGTLSETLETMRIARESGVECIVSHRSGETLDPFIADLAYATGAFGIKTGAPRKPERLAKIDRLIAIAG